MNQLARAPVLSFCLHSLCLHSLCLHSLCLHSFCLHSLCLHSFCLHSFCLHSFCLHSLCLHSLCLHSLCYTRSVYTRSATLALSTLALLASATPCLSSHSASRHVRGSTEGLGLLSLSLQARSRLHRGLGVIVTQPPGTFAAPQRAWGYCHSASRHVRGSTEGLGLLPLSLQARSRLHRGLGVIATQPPGTFAAPQRAWGYCHSASRHVRGSTEGLGLLPLSLQARSRLHRGLGVIATQPPGTFAAPQRAWGYCHSASRHVRGSTEGLGLLPLSLQARSRLHRGLGVIVCGDTTLGHKAADMTPSTEWRREA